MYVFTPYYYYFFFSREAFNIHYYIKKNKKILAITNIFSYLFREEE